MIYSIYIKSHAIGVSDYEDDVSASSIEEAEDYFLKRLNKQGDDWSREMITDYITEDDDHPDPEEQMAKAEAIIDAKRENEVIDEHKRMEDHFTKEPDNFGGNGTNWN